MAEGGIAAALGNVGPEDNWQVHFRDTMRGGKMLNHWRMAQLHAMEAPDRVLELEEWGALFDRTKDGRILQRDFGGHRYPRLAHVGDRTGLEMIRTLQQHAVHRASTCTWSARSPACSRTASRVAGAFGYWRESGKFVVFKAQGGRPRDRRHRQGVRRSRRTPGSAPATATRSAYDAGAELIDMEFIQFHPTGMVWPPSVRGILVTEGVRGDGGTLRNSEGKRFMFDYIPELFKAETADNEEEADRWYEDDEERTAARRTSCRATTSRGRSTPRSRRAAAARTAASSSTSTRAARPTTSRRSACRRCTTSSRSWPTSTSRRSRWRSARPATTSWAASASTPTRRRRRVPGLFAAGEWPAACTASNRLGGNSLSDLLVFGRRAGLHAAEYAKALAAQAASTTAQVEATMREVLEPFERDDGREPVRDPRRPPGRDAEPASASCATRRELKKALDELDRAQAARAARVRGARATGTTTRAGTWRSTSRTCCIVSEAMTRAALERKESRGGHTRDDYPGDGRRTSARSTCVVRTRGRAAAR